MFLAAYLEIGQLVPPGDYEDLGSSFLTRECIAMIQKCVAMNGL